jgi:hypothetical protein
MKVNVTDHLLQQILAEQKKTNALLSDLVTALAETGEEIEEQEVPPAWLEDAQVPAQ